ncbi:MAG: MFS transporter [Firmicutes bacterium]|nr:MFS transporter [Bacillota bacterium]
MRTIVLLGLVSLFTDISSEMVYPLVPLFLTAKLGATPAFVGIIEGIAESLASLLKVFSGYYSDRIQRRKPLAVVGYASAAFGKLALYLATSWTGVLLGRVIDRFGKGIRTAPRDALIAESADRGKLGSAYGLHRALDTLGAVIGVGIAFVLFTRYQGEYSRAFLYSLIPATVGVSVLLLVREGAAQRQGAERPTFSWDLKALDSRLKWFLLIAFLFTLGNSSNQFLLLRAVDLGISPAQVILVYLVYNLVYSLFSIPAGRRSDKVGRRRLLTAGYIFYGLVYFGFAFASHAAQIWWLFGFYGLYEALTKGVERALVAELAPAHNRATALGLHSMLVGLGLLPASLIAGFLWTSIGPKAPFIFGGIMGVSAALGMFLILPKGR